MKDEGSARKTDAGVIPGMTATVWIGKWVRAEEGTLSLHDGKLKFANEKNVLFDCPLNQIEKITWHWYSFSGAFEFWTRGSGYFVSFLPRHATLGAWHAGLAEGRKWRAAMEGRPMPHGSSLIVRLFTSVISLVQAFFYAVFGLTIMMYALDESKAMWIRMSAGVFVLLILYLILYLLWQAVSTPFRRDV